MSTLPSYSVLCKIVRQELLLNLQHVHINVYFKFFLAFLVNCLAFSGIGHAFTKKEGFTGGVH